jgi:hypothetical protein
MINGEDKISKFNKISFIVVVNFIALIICGYFELEIV